MAANALGRRGLERAQRSDIEDTLDGLLAASAGRQLQSITSLVDLIDEDIYSDGCNGVDLPTGATPTAWVIARGLSDGGTRDWALRAALGTAVDLEEILHGLVEVLLPRAVTAPPRPLAS